MKVLHSLKMALSLKYRQEQEVEALMKELAQQVRTCEHAKAPLDQMKDVIGSIGRLSHEKWLEAVNVLAAANNFDVMSFAVDLRPEVGEICADKVMATAREHLKLYGCGDRATWARKRLFLAEEWYRKARCLTAALEAEIALGLKKTEWVRQMWPVR